MKSTATRIFQLAVLTLLVSVTLTELADAKMGYVRVRFTKAALIAGAGVGSGVLTFDGRNHPFSVYGLSLGVSAGASITRLVGSASYLSQLSDFPGTYSAVGVGGALVAGGGGVQLKNDKGVILTLHGVKAGLEFSSNVSGVRITLD
jgi:hypothetical protein